VLIKGVLITENELEEIEKNLINIDTEINLIVDLMASDKNAEFLSRRLSIITNHANNIKWILGIY
jgi:hypothetical protein